MTDAKVLLALHPGDPDYTPNTPYEWTNAEGIMADPDVVAALNATYALITSVAPVILDGGNATSVYTGTFNFDGGSAT